MDQLELFVRIGLFGIVERRVLVNSEFIEFEFKDLTGDYTRIYWKDFKKIRYGIVMIQGYAFYLGRKHKIIIRDISRQEINITLMSPYGFRKKRNHEQFIQIMNAVYDFFLNDYLRRQIEAIQNGHPVTINKVTFLKDALQYKYGKEIKTVTWQDLALLEYREGFYIQDKHDKEKALYINYLEDWNALLLYSMIKSIQQTFVT